MGVQRTTTGTGPRTPMPTVPGSAPLAGHHAPTTMTAGDSPPRIPVGGGGPPHAPARRDLAPSADRPCATDATPRRTAGAAGVAPGARNVDPALVALTGLLGAAAPQSAPPSAWQRLGSQLAALLGGLLDGARTSATPVDMSGPASGGAVPAGPGHAAALDVLQPMPPPLGPVLTLDPVFGTIVDPTRPSPDEPVPAAPSDAAGDEAPSSWLPLPGWFSRADLAERAGGIVDRIRALLDERGITRMQLLVLLVLAPMATAWLIDVVTSIIASR